MRDVHIRHQPVVIADGRDATILNRAAIERTEFADGVALADDKPGRLALVFLVLVCFTDRHRMINAVIGADLRVTGYNAMVPDAGVVTNHHIAIDNSERANRDVGAEFCARIDNGGRMNQRHGRKLFGRLWNVAHGAEQFRLTRQLFADKRLYDKLVNAAFFPRYA